MHVFLNINITLYINTCCMLLPCYDVVMSASYLPVIAVSRCLLGDKVRYDGSHEFNEYISNYIADAFKIIPFCPECLAGMPVPRPPIRLVEKEDGAVAAITQNKSRIDIADSLETTARYFIQKHRSLGGIIFKSKSPSCGVRTTKLFNSQGEILTYSATGLFAQTISARLPHLPIEDDACLKDKKRFLDLLIRISAYSELLNRSRQHHESQFCPPQCYNKIINRYFHDMNINKDIGGNNHFIMETYAAYLMPALSHALLRHESMLEQLLPETYNKLINLIEKL